MAEGSTSNFRWCPTGAAALAAMLAAIGAARQSVRLETYIFTASPLGGRFRDALVRAQQRGARVQALVDAFGSLTLAESFWTPLTQAGGQFRWFNPLALHRWSYRDHRKLLVCDDTVAFVGGCNIAPDYDGDGVTAGWRDLGLQITGPLARELAGTFDRLFAQAGRRHQRLQPVRRAHTHITAGANWKLLASGPGRGHGELKRTLADDIAAAQSVKIISAYFLPTWRLRLELRRVCRRGGRVQLILAGKSDVPLAQLASRRLYRAFLRAGVEIYEYQPQVLHAKLFVLDDVVYAGSANLDTRSLRINHELLVRLSDPARAAEARALFDADLAHCARIEHPGWARSRNLWSKLKEDWAYLLLARLDPWLARRLG
jgi:cardiolipin synthase